MDLQKQFEDLKRGQQELLEILQKNEIKKSNSSIKWLDLNGVSEYLPSKPAHATIYGWLSKKYIPAHKQGNRWIFSVSEIDEWIKKGKVKTVTEIELDADAFLSSKKKGAHNG